MKKMMGEASFDSIVKMATEKQMQMTEKEIYEGMYVEMPALVVFGLETCSAYL